MDPIDNERATARELIAYGRQQGLDLAVLLDDCSFQKDQRWILFWRKDGLPWSGPAHEQPGTLHYNMQGAIDVLPGSLKEAAGAFRGAWTEAGTFETIEQAFALLKAWLLERKEVDDLPSRGVTRSGIG